MDVDEMLAEVVDLRRRRHRVTSRTLKRQFDLDDDDRDRRRNCTLSLMESSRPMGHTCSAPLTS